MNLKKVSSLIIFLISLAFLYFFVWDFKTSQVDGISSEQEKLQTAYQNATEQLSLKNLRLKKQQLGSQDVLLLQNFIPATLHSGYFVYNLGQLANQNHLTIKGIQYTVLDTTKNGPNGEKKLQVEFNLQGRYDDFVGWLQTLEGSDTLVDVDSFRASKDANNSDILNINVKLYAYGIDID
jgi:Tfp pilus assembly protein PilO